MEPQHAMPLRFFVEGYRQDDNRFTLLVQRRSTEPRTRNAQRHNLDYALDNPEDRSQLEQIGMTVRGTRDRPSTHDPERWTGTEFEVDLEAPASKRIKAAHTRGTYALTLAATAAHLWKLVTSGDHHALVNTHPTFLGGGTVLAARWHHRLSTDIDLFWPAGRWARNTRNAHVERWACSTTVPPTLKRFSHNACETEFDAGGIDWIESDFIDTHAHRDSIEDTNMLALGSDEILAAKLYHRAMLEVRDIYDLAVAALKEPHAADQSIQRVHDHDYVGRRHVYALRDYAPLVIHSGKWTRDRDAAIVEPQCPEAWANGPEIVAELAARNIRQIEKEQGPSPWLGREP